jgi:lipoyl(octanoyl) transferase
LIAPAPELPARWVWLGRMRFAAAAALQEKVREAVLSGERGDTLLLCEHDPVITLGRSARPEHVLLPPEALARQGIEVERASRGGDVTYHGPGQLVGYPIFRLRRGLVRHMEDMAAAIVSVLEGLGIAGKWRRDLPGVWVGGEKICAFGVHVRHRVTIHGFALNVSTPIEAFAAIVPCGLREGGVTSIARLRGSAPPLADLAAAVASAFAISFRSPLHATRDLTKHVLLPIANRNARSIE